MEMHQIKYFLATCETLNFTEAAEAANVSQPALTKAIKLLEDKLGAPLFDRQCRPLRLTELGGQLKTKFDAIFKLSKEIKAQASLFRDFEKATFTLGVVNTIGPDHFSSLVGNMQRRLPGIIDPPPYLAAVLNDIFGCLKREIWYGEALFPRRGHWQVA